MLLTPVVLTLTRRLGLPVLPFAVTTVWLANTASLLLPVSNLTNLLAAPRLAGQGMPFVVLMAAPALGVLCVTLTVLWARYRTQLRGTYRVPAPPVAADRVLFRTATLVCLAAAPLFAVGANPAVTATLGAAVLVAAFTFRARHLLTPALLPWRLVATTLALFLLVQATLDLGALRLLTDLAGTGAATADLLRLSLTAAVSSNLVNNLPAYLALEPVVGTSAPRLAALLVGTNAGPLLLPWGSLATLLWWDRCRAHGTTVPASHFIGLGLLGVPAVLGVGTLALALSHP